VVVYPQIEFGSTLCLEQRISIGHSVPRLDLPFLKDSTMRRFMAGAIALGLLTTAACTDSSVDSDNSPVTSSDLTDALPVDITNQNAFAETDHREHDTTSQSSHETAAASSHRQHGHGQRHRDHGTSAADHAVGMAIGDVVPDFEVTIKGSPRKLSELQKDTGLTEDGTLAFTFWCSFCHSCRDVEADLDKLATKYEGKVAVIALDASAGETAQAVSEFATKKGLSLPIALNPDGSAADLFGITTTTTTVVIDSKGVLRYRGRFHDDEHAYADEAIMAVLAGNDVVVKETTHRG
jgi:thiol-disulfide isomerase/thioredoxin